MGNNTTKPPYDGYVETLSKKFESRLNEIEIDYNFDYGNEFEIAICEVLRSFLPEKYGVCRGHVVNFKGGKIGDDIIIYDQQKFPSLRIHDKQQYARKENIPIESVYAYFEVKHSLDDKTYKKALKQIRIAKKFFRNRDKVDEGTFNIYSKPLEQNVKYCPDYPNYRNPIYCGIIARKTEFDEDKIKEKVKELNKNDNENDNPDIILIDKNQYIQIGYKKEDKKEFAPTLFLLEEKNHCYEYENREKLAYGLFLISLITALDWIILGKMEWIDCLNHYVDKNQ
ncbi:MAG: hypothetical protein JXR69_04775 [Candidatus Delongbacteria bacterium]|nr:hypothetical protein [Candidatus Delongbacteria bacterium]